MTLSYRIGHTLSSWLARCFYDFRVVNEAGLHFEGPALVCSNHASFFDPPFIGQAFEKPIHFFARKTLFNNPLMGATLRSWQSIPIDRDHPDTSSLKTVIRLLRGGGKVLMFPEGTRTEDGHLLPAEAGVGLFLAKARAPVLPLRLFGTFEAFPRHRILPRPSSVTLVVGEKYTPDLAARSHLSGRELYQSLADEVMQRIAALQLP
ncbi:MAG: 1-acyl-sn-glycerol-3-phosphate acyltransferase [Verrucomicrobiales bacterium]|nr:1-acyl-sn-glycerol-3-phosphate acyltransferase [Verrucomicrobiales bacterium]